MGLGSWLLIVRHSDPCQVPFLIFLLVQAPTLQFSDQSLDYDYDDLSNRTKLNSGYLLLFLFKRPRITKVKYEAVARISLTYKQVEHHLLDLQEAGIFYFLLSGCACVHCRVVHTVTYCIIKRFKYFPSTM